MSNKIAALEAQEQLGCRMLFLTLPGLRAFWPMSNIQPPGFAPTMVRDLGGGDCHLTPTNTPTYGQYNSLVPHALFVSGSSQYLSRADGGAANWADITGTETYIVAGDRGLTLGAWVWPDVLGGTTQGILSKYGASGTRSYMLYIHTSNKFGFVISPAGVAVEYLVSTVNLSIDNWYFVAARFIPSTSLDIWVNGVQDTDATITSASIFDSTSNFTVGAQSDPTNYLDGRVSMAFLCASALQDATISSLFQQTRGMFGV